MNTNFTKYMDNKYCYNAYVTDVYDGDTITCNIDVGFGINLFKQKIRLFGIDTPELRGVERPLGLLIRNKLRSLILNKDIILYTIKDKKGKYGRLLGIICLDNLIINQMLLEDPRVKSYFL